MEGTANELDRILVSIIRILGYLFNIVGEVVSAFLMVFLCLMVFILIRSLLKTFKFMSKKRGGK